MHPTISRYLTAIFFAVISALMLPARVWAEVNDAVILLNQMNDALHTLEYQGKLVYLKDGEAYNLSIRHTVNSEGVEKEVVTLLDQNSDDYVRESTAFTLSSLPKITPEMQQVYSFDMGGMGRVAGRPCRIVVARPKDRKRYLQKYCIDLDRSVVLKYSLINQYHKPVERFVFTDFEVISTRDKAVAETMTLTDPDAIEVSSGNTLRAAGDQVLQKKAPEAAFLGALPLVEGTSLSDNVGDTPGVVDGFSEKPPGGEPDQYTEWFFDPLPVGFRIISTDRVRNSAGHDEQIVISDGLSSVSVFISDSNQPVQQYKPIRSGALNIVTRNYQGYAITLVGEVPEDTLNDIYKGLRRATIKSQ